jgi:hypothetical protein
MGFAADAMARFRDLIEPITLGNMCSMSGNGMKTMGAAAVIVALSTLAGAADLSPPSPTRHRPHGPLGRLPLPPRADLTTKNWGATSTFDGPPVRFSTDPSGVIGGTKFNSNYELSPDWLTGAKGRGLPQAYREFQHHDGL